MLMRYCGCVCIYKNRVVEQTEVDRICNIIAIGLDFDVRNDDALT